VNLFALSKAGSQFHHDAAQSTPTVTGGHLSLRDSQFFVQLKMLLNL
jgi:hypothetical protein